MGVSELFCLIDSLVLEVLKKSVGNRMIEQFVQVCRSNNLLGRMNIDFDKQKIEIAVVPCDFDSKSEEIEAARKKVSSLYL